MALAFQLNAFQNNAFQESAGGSGLPDTFTGQNGDDLTTYNPSKWAVAGSSDSGFGIVIQGNKAVTDRSSGTRAYYYWQTSPNDADYDVSADVYISADSASDGYSGVTGRLQEVGLARDNYSWAVHRTGTNAFEMVLYKQVNSSATLLGSYSLGNVTGNTLAIKLSMVGTAIKGYVDGVERVSVTDSAHTSVGKAGLYYNNTHSGVGVTFMDNFNITNMPGGGAAELVVDFSKTVGAATLSSTVLVDAVASATKALGTTAVSSAANNDIAATATTTLGGASLTSAVLNDIVSTFNRTLGSTTVSSAASSTAVLDLIKSLGLTTLASALSSDVITTLSKTLGATTLVSGATAPVVADSNSALGSVSLFGMIGQIRTADLDNVLGAVSVTSGATVLVQPAQNNALEAVSATSQSVVDVVTVLSTTLASVALSAHTGQQSAAGLSVTLGNVSAASSTAVDAVAYLSGSVGTVDVSGGLVSLVVTNSSTQLQPATVTASAGASALVADLTTMLGSTTVAAIASSVGTVSASLQLGNAVLMSGVSLGTISLNASASLLLGGVVVASGTTAPLLLEGASVVGVGLSGQASVDSTALSSTSVGTVSLLSHTLAGELTVCDLTLVIGVVGVLARSLDIVPDKALMVPTLHKPARVAHYWTEGRIVAINRNNRTLTSVGLREVSP